MTQNIFIEKFLKSHQIGIQNVFNKYAKLIYQSFDDFISDLLQFLTVEYNKISDKNLSEMELTAQLFYTVNQFCKSKYVPQPKSKKHYICPGCLYLGQNSILDNQHYLKCIVCESKINTTLSNKEMVFFKTFAKHNYTGYRCNDCNRFIPTSNSQTNIVCPYFDCLFVGNQATLKKMYHPTIKDDQLLNNNISLVNNNNTSQISNNISFIKETIEYQLNNLMFTNFNFTIKHKELIYKSFLQLLEIYPQEMSDYLIYQSRSGGFQHKVFQKYIFLLEESLPIVIRKNGKVTHIDNLLDPNLSLFDGISTFEAVVSKNTIKNNTQEYYIGGRSATYTKPYYIGKILNIINKENKYSIMENIVEYSFSKIKLHDIDDNTKVIVTHLRIPPHYQMGGMVYVNRIRKKIVDALMSKLC